MLRLSTKTCQAVFAKPLSASHALRIATGRGVLAPLQHRGLTSRATVDNTGPNDILEFWFGEGRWGTPLMGQADLFNDRLSLWWGINPVSPTTPLAFALRLRSARIHLNHGVCRRHFSPCRPKSRRRSMLVAERTKTLFELRVPDHYQINGAPTMAVTLRCCSATKSLVGPSGRPAIPRFVARKGPLELQCG